jgi:hypothetical protein
MLIKWIQCQVKENSRDAFSKGQQEWKPLTNVEGFIAQFGGWNITNPNEACILALWKNEETYKSFMKNHHDSIYEQTKQQGTYDHIKVQLFQSKLVINEHIPTNTPFLFVTEMVVQNDLSPLPDWYIVGYQKQQAARYLIVELEDRKKLTHLEEVLSFETKQIRLEPTWYLMDKKQ